MQLTRSTGSTGGRRGQPLAPLLLLAITALLTACVSAPRDIAYDQTLISGEAAFGHVIEPAASTNMLALSDEMVTFLGRDLTGASFEMPRLVRLMKKLKRAGYFDDPYDPDGTYSAATTRCQYYAV